MPLSLPQRRSRETGCILQEQPIEVYSSNYTLYGEMSARVMTTLAQWTLDVEVYSIDEAFLHLPTCSPDVLPAYGQTIRTTI